MNRAVRKTGSRKLLPGHKAQRLKVLKGGKDSATVLKSPIRDAVTDEDAFAAPLYLTVEGRNIWNAAVRTLTLIEELSLDHLYGLHQLAYAWQKMVKKMQADQDIEHKDNDLFRKMLIEYGLTPASRIALDPEGKARFHLRGRAKHSDKPATKEDAEREEAGDNPFAALRNKVDDIKQESGA